MIAQGDVCWADLPDPVRSGPGFRRPVLVVQGDAFNRSRVVVRGTRTPVEDALRKPPRAG